MFSGFKKQRYLKKIDKNNIPTHIAFIMDGNGRWAKKRMLPRSVGHREGAGALKRVSRACGNIGVKYMTVYAFSTENWSRPKDEVDAIMDLLLNSLKNAEKELNGEDVRIKIIGDITPLSDEIKAEIKRVESVTGNNKMLTLNIALNYGSRDEIIQATKKISKKVADGEITEDEITQEVIANHLYTYDCPDPELLVRSSGEQRISNFLLWQCAYSEFVFTPKLWPDFSEQDVLEVILAYQKRDRRFGGIKK